MIDVDKTFRELEVLRTGHFQLSSGKHSDTYLQCQLALQRPDVALELGRALAERLRAQGAADVDVVASPALGGILAGFAVASALGVRFVFSERKGGPDGRAMVFRRGQRVEPGERVLVVEDVVTTGGSAMEVVALCEQAGAKVAGTAAIVDRSAGLPEEERPPLPPVALLTVTAQTWTAQECPRCAAGDPVDSPGSRR
ncbi:MAG TPA: orotate phosphoribosyltransferase [Egibacteraceae bacterium]|nr:orotate phosphoribosyltransferase [Egibacteraceae bacterium]